MEWVLRFKYIDASVYLVYISIIIVLELKKYDIHSLISFIDDKDCIFDPPPWFLSYENRIL